MTPPMTQAENSSSGRKSTEGAARMTAATRAKGRHVARVQPKQPARVQQRAGCGAALLAGGRAATMAAGARVRPSERAGRALRLVGARAVAGFWAGRYRMPRQAR